MGMRHVSRLGLAYFAAIFGLGFLLGTIRTLLLEPWIGALPAVTCVDRNTPLTDIPRQPGAYVLSGYGARGLVWSAIAAELFASQLEGEPLPLERDLCDAVDPARFLLRPPRAGRIEE